MAKKKETLPVPKAKKVKIKRVAPITPLKTEPFSPDEMEGKEVLPYGYLQGKKKNVKFFITKDEIPKKIYMSNIIVNTQENAEFAAVLVAQRYAREFVMQQLSMKIERQYNLKEYHISGNSWDTIRKAASAIILSKSDKSADQYFREGVLTCEAIIEDPYTSKKDVLAAQKELNKMLGNIAPKKVLHVSSKEIAKKLSDKLGIPNNEINVEHVDVTEEDADGS